MIFLCVSSWIINEFEKSIYNSAIVYKSKKNIDHLNKFRNYSYGDHGPLNCEGRKFLHPRRTLFFLILTFLNGKDRRGNKLYLIDVTNEFAAHNIVNEILASLHSLTV